MGKHMALNLAQSLAKQDLPLPPLMVYNRTASKAEELAESSQGLIKVCKDLVELGQCCDLIFTSLANDAAAESVYAQLVQGEEKRNGTKEDRHSAFKVVYADTSTLYPETSGELTRRTRL
jgi:3-hydroxyisobutyrate dehydrogenase-like beta-hydroxyacid dehydrogenase